MGCQRWLRLVGIALLMYLGCGAAHAAPQVGWWWNPNESGRGFFIESAGGNFFMAAYFYADDGRARWLVSGGSSADPYHYSGPLLEVRNGQTLFGPYVPPGAPANAEAITVDFSDDAHGTIVWPGGTIPIVREIFDTTVASNPPESGWWWNSAESGSGYSIEVEGGTLFMVGFMYDDAGNPIWYLSAGPMSSPTTYQGSLVQVANGQTLTGPYHPPSPPTTVGTLAITFTAPNAATLTFTDVGLVAAALPSAGRTRTTRVVREFSEPSLYALPRGFKGSYSLILRVRDPESANLVADYFLNGDMTFTAIGYHPGDTIDVYGPVDNPFTMPIHIHVDYSSYDEDIKLKCTGTFDMDYVQPAGGASGLIVNNVGRFVGDVKIAGLVTPFDTTCINSDGDATIVPFVNAVGVNIHMVGNVEGDLVKGQYTFTVPIGTSGGTNDYSFAAVR